MADRCHRSFFKFTVPYSISRFHFLFFLFRFPFSLPFSHFFSFIGKRKRERTRSFARSTAFLGAWPRLFLGARYARFAEAHSAKMEDPSLFSPAFYPLSRDELIVYYSRQGLSVVDIRRFLHDVHGHSVRSVLCEIPAQSATGPTRACMPVSWWYSSRVSTTIGKLPHPAESGHTRLERPYNI